MPYKDPERQREYMRQWVARRRAAWFADKVCAKCGSGEDLELDHVDPSAKVSHAVWSWSAMRREAELAKCRPLCKECHAKKSATERAKGEQNGRAKLSEGDVLAIRASDLPADMLSRAYGVVPRHIYRIRNGSYWKHLSS